jgi:hypothetical protein
LQVPASPQHLNPAGIARRPNETKGEKESRPIHQGITNALIVIPACDFKLTEKTAFSAWGHLRKRKMNSAVYPPEAGANRIDRKSACRFAQNRANLHEWIDATQRGCISFKTTETK